MEMKKQHAAPKRYKARPVTPIVKTMERSYQKGGKIGEGTPLASGAKQATITFTPNQYKWLASQARGNGISLSEQVRWCVRQFQD
jgi:hypothetical protein